jgi:uncharacterized membrane protein
MNELHDKRLTIIGAGNIGRILLERLRAAGVLTAHLAVCDAVQTSVYSELLGIPVALLGGLGYLGILGLWVVSQLGRGQAADLARLGLYGLALVGTLVSLYLTFLEPFVIG